MLLVEVSSNRIRELAKHLRPYRDVIVNLYRRDPQYSAVESLLKTRGCSEGFVLALVNALVSYQLSMPGEQYWLEFAEYFSENRNLNYYEAFRDFLSTRSPRLLEQKLRRIRSILGSGLLEELQENPAKYCQSIVKLVEKLAETLKASPQSKTLLFAGKIYGYICNLCGLRPNYSGLSIPVDYRNSLLALVSCIITVRGEQVTAENIFTYARKIQTHYSKLVQRAWEELCRELEVPCVHLDTLTWLITGIITRSECSLEKAGLYARQALSVDLPAITLRELVKCWCVDGVS
jgi:DNA-(apurinic or apyrimidinic site) lyase